LVLSTFRDTFAVDIELHVLMKDPARFFRVIRIKVYAL
jgi:hypothetical protein